MSSLEEKLKLGRQKLTHRKTKITDSTGRVTLEELTDQGFVSEQVDTTVGYVIDNKPDFQVALVLPGLSLGSQDVAANEELLRKYGITHVLSLGIEIPKFEGIQYFYVPALDLPEFNLKNIFEHCFSLIDSAREEGGHVYVHCNAGVSRSATIVIAYLMKDKDLTFNNAFEYLKKLRPCVNPNPGFVNQLLVYEKLLRS